MESKAEVAFLHGHDRSSTSIHVLARQGTAKPSSDFRRAASGPADLHGFSDVSTADLQTFIEDNAGCDEGENDRASRHSPRHTLEMAAATPGAVPMMTASASDDQHQRRECVDEDAKTTNDLPPCTGRVGINSSIGSDPLPDLLARKGAQDTLEHEHHSKPTVLVINTGGTLGMQKDEMGRLAPVPGYFTSQMLIMGDETNSDEMPGFDIIEYAPLLDSSCFQPSDWERIAKDIGRAYHSYDGFVVCMGTDTMAYASSALSFMLQNLGKTVVFTGSQIPFAEVYNDARRNVIVAMIMAANQEIPEVCVFFSDRLLRANRAVKIDSLALTAFDSPNFPALGRLGVSMRYRRDLVLPPPRGPFRVHTKMDSRVVVIKLIPGFDDDALLAIARHSSSLKAVVLELYGTGNSPSQRVEFLKFFQMCKDRGILIVVVTQCLRGGVALGTYAVGAGLGDCVISGGDMTTAAAVTKLAYLFGRTDNLKAVADLMQQSLRGEMSSAITFAHPMFGGAGKVEIGRHVERALHESGPLPRL